MTTVPTRLDLFRQLPMGSVVAEVGVQRGVFSSQILSLPNIDTLHLIDPWREGVGDPKDPAYLKQGGHDENLRWVRTLLAHEIDNHRAIIHRMTSLQAAMKFSKDQYLRFDGIFLDATHTYGDALFDLNAWARLIRLGGSLMGHDYVDTDASRAMGFGVVQAVEQFLAENPAWQLVSVTSEEWKSFCIQRK